MGLFIIEFLTKEVHGLAYDLACQCSVGDTRNDASPLLLPSGPMLGQLFSGRESVGISEMCYKYIDTVQLVIPKQTRVLAGNILKLFEF
jgi:hypothetical protein